MTFKRLHTMNGVLCHHGKEAGTKTTVASVIMKVKHKMSVQPFNVGYVFLVHDGENYFYFWACSKVIARKWALACGQRCLIHPWRVPSLGVCVLIPLPFERVGLEDNVRHKAAMLAFYKEFGNV